MAATIKNRQARARVYFAVLIAAAACMLSVPGFFWEPVPLWLQLTVPGLLVVGLAGSFFKGSALRVIGWMGIVGFAFLLIPIIFLTDDYILQGTPEGLPNVPSPGASLWRIILFVVNCVLLILCFRRLAPAPDVDPSSTVPR